VTATGAGPAGGRAPPPGRSPTRRAIDLKAEHEGKGKKLRWQRFTAPESAGGRFPVLVDLRRPLGDAEDAVGYASTAFRVGEARTVEFRGAGDDNLTAWVNGKRAFSFEEWRNGVRLDRHRFRVRLRAGVNTVLLKVCQAPFDADSPEPNRELLLRVTDETGRGVTFPSALPALTPLSDPGRRSCCPAPPRSARPAWQTNRSPCTARRTPAAAFCSGSSAACSP
jgi:hypothetical protein